MKKMPLAQQEINVQVMKGCLFFLEDLKMLIKHLMFIVQNRVA